MEAGSDKVKELITNTENEIWVLELALIELQCAIYRKIRNKELPEDNLNSIQKAIEQQFSFFQIIRLGSDIIEEAKILIKQFGKQYRLRTLDALHVAGWNLMAEDNWHFVSSDNNQLAVVNKMTYQTISV